MLKLLILTLLQQKKIYNIVYNFLKPFHLTH